MTDKISKAQKKFNRYLRWILALILPVFLVVVFLMQASGFRYQIFDSTIKLPEFPFFILIRRNLLSERNFENAVQLLNRQLDLVIWYSSGRNQLLPGMIYNADYVMKSARWPVVFSQTLPFLECMVKLYPDSYDA